jgi:DNA polymerase III subunit alpha
MTMANTDLFFHAHCHSHYSSIDAMTPVASLVAKAAKHGQPGMALTDHGVLSGNYQLYRECMNMGMLPFPGLEAYLVHDVDDKDAKRYHLTLLAYNTTGVKHLNKLSSLSHQRSNYRYKPLLDFHMLDEAKHYGMTEGIAALTGCYFGWVQQAFSADPDLTGNMAMAIRRAEQIDGWFPMTFIEVQHHDKDDDDEMLNNLWHVSLSTGLDMIATQDCHYCDKREKPLHGLMKQLIYGEGDAVFPGSSYHLASTQWVRMHYPKLTWDEMQASYEWLLAHNRVSLPWLDKFKMRLPSLKTDPADFLYRQCTLELVKRKLHHGKYMTRLNEEIDIIRQTKMGDYFILVSDYCKWATDQGIMINARGSANGSLVCWLMGITAIDPILWHLDFDRFLTVDRERPPDIDLDVEDARRADVLSYINLHWPIVQIGNYNRLGYDEEGRGSILVTYLAAMRRKLGPDEYKAQFGDVKTLHDLDHDVRNGLYGLGGHTLFRGVGAHAAGYALDTSTHSLDDWMPTMLIPSSDTTVTQMTMDDVEDAGFIKIDVLGLRTLTVVKRCLEAINETDWEWIPLNDAKTFTYLRKGHGDNGIFQLEGWSSAKGCREMKVKNIEDLILVNALYRPAPSAGGFTRQFLRRRQGEPYKKIHPLVDQHLDHTFGIAVFQEQVLRILRDLGFDAGERMKLLKAVKASNSKVAKALRDFHKSKGRFKTLCYDAGMDAEQADKVWAMVEGYSNYGFNRAHAAAYALLGYRTAYLQVNYPLEYMAALLTSWSGTNKEKLYTRHARRIGIRVLPPDVNISGIEWGIDRQRNALRRPLTSIKGVGAKAAVEISVNKPYADYNDMLTRCNARIVTGGKVREQPNGVIQKLLVAGALRSLPDAPALNG